MDEEVKPEGAACTGMKEGDKCEGKKCEGKPEGAACTGEAAPEAPAA